LVLVIVSRKFLVNKPALAVAVSLSLFVFIACQYQSKLISTSGNKISVGIVMLISGFVLSWFIYRILTQFPSFVEKMGVAAIGIAMLLLIGCLIQAFIPPYRWNVFTSRKTGRPNIILITLDTTRADHFSCYGYGAKTTPFLDSLAKQGVLFRNAYTTATWTLPAHGSLFTGQMPSVLGIGFKNFFLAPGTNTLAEIFKQHGYTTGGFIGGPFLVSAFRINQGFDYYNENLDNHSKLKRFSLFRTISHLLKKQIWETNGQRNGAEINSELFPYLEWAQSHKPFFLFVNYFDAHDPYDPPQKYRDILYPGKIRWKKGNLRSLFMDKKRGVALFSDGKALEESDFQQLRYLYDAEIRYLDDQIASLWNKLKELGLLNDTIVVFISDHGETLGEHGFLDHGHLLYQEQVRIPFLIIGPGKWSGGEQVAESVRIVDVFPTLLEQLQIPQPQNIQGRSLLHLLEKQAAQSAPVYAELDADPHPRYAAFRKDQKMILKDWNKYIEVSTGQNILFDLAADPRELTNIAGKNPELSSALATELTRYFSQLKPAHPARSIEMDEESKEKLKALGYIE
jgi:arylsulfatase A-like enzyme